MLNVLLTSATLAFTPQPPVAALSQGPTEAADVLRRVVIVGGSLSACQGLDDELTAHVDWSDFFQSALRQPGVEVFEHSDTMYQLSAKQRGTKQLATAANENPSLLVALDYLPWFVYGSRFRDERFREVALDNALKLLERFECTILLGDIPDWSLALDGQAKRGGAYLVPGDLPSPASLAALNAKLASWAAQRPHVSLVPVAGFYESLRAHTPIEVRGNRWANAAYDELLQADTWHPNVEGMVALTCVVLDRLCAQTGAAADAFRWERAAIRDELMKRTADERALRLERQRKRAERQQRRAERGEDQKGKRKRDGADR